MSIGGTIVGTWQDDPESLSPPRAASQVGVIGDLGLSLAEYLRRLAGPRRHQNTREEGVAKSVIHIFLPGGMAHQESWDPTPRSNIGEMASIKTNVDGIVINETLQHTAKITDKIAICRSMTHGEAARRHAQHIAGYRPSPAHGLPSMGSIVSHEFGVRNNLPPYVCVPSQPTTYAGSGYLSSSFSPFSLGADPANGGFQVQDLALPGGVDEKRFDTRKNMLAAVNEHFSKTEKSDNLDAMDTFYQRAYSLISSQKAREAFDINKEEAKVRDEYGRNAAGQRMLLARRLVEAGVRFVSLPSGGAAMPAGIRESPGANCPPSTRASRPWSATSIAAGC